MMPLVMPASMPPPSPPAPPCRRSPSPPPLHRCTAATPSPAPLPPTSTPLPPSPSPLLPLSPLAALAALALTRFCRVLQNFGIRLGLGLLLGFLAGTILRPLALLWRLPHPASRPNPIPLSQMKKATLPKINGTQPAKMLAALCVLNCVGAVTPPAETHPSATPVKMEPALAMNSGTVATAPSPPHRRVSLARRTP